jgi:hypothetical protein
MEITLSKALYSLRPTSSYVMHNDDIKTLEWLDPTTKPPTLKELKAEQTRLKQLFDNTEYQRMRALEYPSIGDQLDALFKAGLFPEEMAAQIQAIKDKYPKGTE